MKKITSPDATAVPGKHAVKVRAGAAVKTNPPRKPTRLRGWVA